MSVRLEIGKRADEIWKKERCKKEGQWEIYGQDRIEGLHMKIGHPLALGLRPLGGYL